MATGQLREDDRWGKEALVYLLGRKADIPICLNLG